MFINTFRLCLILISAFVLYHLIPFKIAEIQARAALDSSASSDVYHRVLHWNAGENDALTNLAEFAKDESDFEQAKHYALAALSVDPTNGHAMSILILAYENLQETAHAEKAVTLAPKQWPAHSYVHIALSNYWGEKGDAEKVLSEWDLLLTRHSGLYKPIFPILLSYANADDSRDLLVPYAIKPASWWNDFFTYMVNNKASLPVLEYFYQQRSQTNVPLEKNERNAYVKKLQQAKIWKLAYSVWIEGLSSQQFSKIGTLYDGGFESDSHDSGYDWNYNQSKPAKITLGRTRGIKGSRALHLVFNKRKSIKFKHVWQRLLLEPGRRYQLIMQTRIDGLKNPQGLAWRIYCADENQQQLGESQALKGREKWHEITFDFSVPKQGCTSQIIRLEAMSQYHHEQFFQGGIWFDQVDIVPLTKETVSDNEH